MQDTAEQLRLAYDNNHFAKFTVSSAGKLTVTATSTASLTSQLHLNYLTTDIGAIPINIGNSGSGYPGVAYNTVFTPTGGSKLPRGGYGVVALLQQRRVRLQGDKRDRSSR